MQLFWSNNCNAGFIYDHMNDLWTPAANYFNFTISFFVGFFLLTTVKLTPKIILQTHTKIKLKILKI